MLVTQNRSAVRTTDLRAALEALPAPVREAAWLRDVEEYSYAEIAQMESVPVGTVLSRISRGRRLLYAQLADGASAPKRTPTGDWPVSRPTTALDP